MAIVAACSDAPTTPLAAPNDPAPADLALTFPSFDADLLVTTFLDGEEGGEPLGPAAVTSPGEEPPESESTGEDVSSFFAQIYDAKTWVSVGIPGGQSIAQGEHSYQGNKGRVETTLSLAFEGQQIGAQRSVAEKSGVFLFDFGLSKYISTIARIYHPDHGCGLSAWASSSHSAWWEAVFGASAAVFHRAERTSQSPLSQSAPCAPPPPPPPPLNGGNDYTGTGGYCWVSVWYDLDTGEIVDSYVLFCDNVIGG
jgi:hypothetical protein